MADAQTLNQIVLLIQTAKTQTLPTDHRLRSLSQILDLLRQHPSLIPTLTPHVYSIAAEGIVELRLKVLEVLEQVVTRVASPDLVVLTRSLETLGFLINSDPEVMKRTIQVATTIYPVFFKWICTSVPDITAWQASSSLRQQLLTLIIHPNDGVKINITRYYHAVIMTQSSKGDTSVPTEKEDISVDILPPTHPFLKRGELIAEAVTLLQQMITLLSTPTASPSLLTANITSMIPLMKKRPNYIPMILSALMSWHRAPPPVFNQTQVRSVVRMVKVALLNARRLPAAAQYIEPLTETLYQLGAKPHELQPKRKVQPPPPFISSTSSASSTPPPSGPPASSSSGAQIATQGVAKRPPPVEDKEDLRKGVKRVKAEGVDFDGSGGDNVGMEGQEDVRHRLWNFVRSGGVPVGVVVDVVLGILRDGVRWEGGLDRLQQANVETFGPDSGDLGNMISEAAMAQVDSVAEQVVDQAGPSTKEEQHTAPLDVKMEEAQPSLPLPSELIAAAPEEPTPPSPPAQEDEETYITHPPNTSSNLRAELIQVEEPLGEEQRREIVRGL
ncbi:hypothetical protein HK097_004291, partial [Rhizophlyctis rosea]